MKQLLVFFALLLCLTACHKRLVPVSAPSSGSTGSATINNPEGVQSSEAAATPTISSNSADMLAGSKIYRASCGKCHELKDAGSYKKIQWNSIMNTMAPKAKLDDQQKSQVLAYVLYNAKDGSKNTSN